MSPSDLERLREEACRDARREGERVLADLSSITTSSTGSEWSEQRAETAED